MALISLYWLYPDINICLIKPMFNEAASYNSLYTFNSDMIK